MKHKKASDVKTVIKKDYSKKVYFDLEDFDEKGHLFQTVTIPPKTKQREHWHDKQTEVFFVLEGECHVFINGKDIWQKRAMLLYAVLVINIIYGIKLTNHLCWQYLNTVFLITTTPTGLSEVLI